MDGSERLSEHDIADVDASTWVMSATDNPCLHESEYLYQFH